MSARTMIKRNKPTGPDEVVIDMLTVLDVWGIDNVTKMINETNDGAKIL